MKSYNFEMKNFLINVTCILHILVSLNVTNAVFPLKIAKKFECKYIVLIFPSDYFPKDNPTNCCDDYNLILGVQAKIQQN